MRSKVEPYGLHWFRRDLRIAGNPALRKIFAEYPGRVLGIFCFDSKFLARPDFSPDRFQFFLETLKALKAELEDCGSDLLFCDVGPDHGFSALFERLKAKGLSLPGSVSWNRDYEPFAVDRDQRMQKWFHAQGVHTLTERDHLLIEPHEIVKDSNPSQPYQIYTPFSKKWLHIFDGSEVKDRLSEQKKGLTYLEKRLAGKTEPFLSIKWGDFAEDNAWKLFESYLQKNATRVNVPIPEAGSLAAYRQLKSFVTRLDAYEEERDFPARKGTSRFSIFFKNGSLTTAQVMAAFELKSLENKGRGKFLKELVWREFYYYILAKFPAVEHKAFDRRFEHLSWRNEQSQFEAWKAGLTGFPIVDAGMRELQQTGWMHNRVRMIVASFLTKDLLIDWRLGERYFMEKLLDGDLAPNNGGWQWAASTGCDPQPYFRIFNPELQSQKFDPEGEYIRRFIPELAGLKGKAIHAPSAAVAGYPKPIVDHARQRQLALEIYGAAKSPK